MSRGRIDAIFPRSMRLLLLALTCAWLAACDRNAPAARPDPPPASRPADAATDAAAPAPEAPVVPKGCEINLAGRYRLAKKPHGRFEVEDDGTHLTARPIGAGDAGPDLGAVVLDRTAKGFVGLVVGTARTATGVDCPVAFRAELVACTSEELTLRSDDSVTVDERCRMRRDAASATEKVLVRE
jgi:hypothetical protein